MRDGLAKENKMSASRRPVSRCARLRPPGRDGSEEDFRFLARQFGESDMFVEDSNFAKLGHSSFVTVMAINPLLENGACY